MKLLISFLFWNDFSVQIFLKIILKGKNSMAIFSKIQKIFNFWEFLLKLKKNSEFSGLL